MRIDAHQHFWIYRHEDYPWIDDRMGILKRDYTPADLEPLLKRQGFEGSIAVQARSSLDETRQLLAWASEHELVRGVVGWVDLTSPSVEADLEALARAPGLVGLRHIVQDEPDDRFLLREDFQRGLALLPRFGLAYDILVYPRQLEAVVALVARFDEHRFVLDHLAKPPVASGELEPWASYMRQLGRFENLYCKLSGMVTEAVWGAWKKEDFTPYLDVVVEAFGTERLLVGSDWPVCTLAADYDGVIDIVDSYTALLDREKREAIFGGNAAEVYRLETRAHAI